MYIRKTTKSYKGKTYDNYLLVESLSTPKGPRQKILCSLGSLAPAPRQEWLALAHRMEASLAGQQSLSESDAAIETAKVNGRRGRRLRGAAARADSDARVMVDAERVSIEEAREAGSVHVGHQMWQQLGLNEILGSAGLSQRACLLSEVMTLNRLIFQYAQDKQKAPESLNDLVSAHYLERVPDDITGSDTWETESGDGVIMTLEQKDAGGIVGVHSGSNQVGSNGKPYSEW